MLKRLKEKTNDEKMRLRMNKRVNFIFAVIIFAFVLIVLRLGYLQIVQGSQYNQMIRESENVTVNESVPRGRILDRNGNVIVDNASKKSITYTRGKNTNQEEIMDTAKKLSQLIKMDTSKITERDKKDFWIQKNPNQAKKLMKKEQQLYENGDISQDDYDNTLRHKISDKDLDTLSKKDLEVLAIYREMMQGSTLSPRTIKNDKVTDEEYASVSQKLSDLPGINTEMDWDRKYPYGKTL